MVKALLFDVFGTLVDWRGSIARQMRPHLGDEARALAFADAWRGLYEPAMQAVRAGRRPFVPLDVLHRENLDRILPDFGLGGLGEAARQEMVLFWHRLDPWPDVPEGLAALKRTHLVCAHSNGNVALMVRLARHAGFVWDMILGAEVTGHYKPEPRSYRRAAELLALAPGDCMMVAAHNSDLAAARGCGLAAAFVARPTEFGAGQTTDLAAEADWEIVADDLADLARRLSG